MTRGGVPFRLGATLLIVLAALAILAAASTVLVRFASDAQAQRRIDECTIHADDLLNATEAPIQDWLMNSTTKVVLPPEIEEPRIEVLHHRWVLGKDTYELRITAWDQCGMVPLELIRAGSPLRSGVPTALLSQSDEVSVQPNAHAGLDAYQYEKALSHELASPYPKPHLGKSTLFGEAGIEDEQSPSESAVAVGGLVATHNSPPHRINVNTASVALIDRVLQIANHGGLDQIIAARSAGKPAPASGADSLDSSPEQTLQLVGTSSIWSFRIDARVGPVRKSWWAVYAPLSESRKSKSNRYPWECVQRLVIAY